MLDVDGKSHGTQPPTESSPTGHTLPRRTSPANSVTLRHHRIAHDASLRASPGDSDPVVTTNSTNSRRQSSGESDPKTWFDQSNENPTATYDSNVMDVDPPFFQRESDSSNEDKPYMYSRPSAPTRHTTGHSSSADDYRSVIDDLTIEIQKLKEELKRYKQTGPNMLQKEKLFEIKIHGLPKRKKRELETALRDFAAGLEGSPDTSSSQRKKSSRHTTRDHMYSGSGSMSKHASSSSSSNIRPVDSAYASMSTGAHSSGTSLGRPSTSSRTKTSEQKVENYLRDIPAGLYPRHMAMSDKEKKKLVVRRLEQLFTGKISGRAVPGRDPLMPHAGHSQTLTVADAQLPQPRQMVHLPPTLATADQAREAKILPTEQQSGQLPKKGGSRDNHSTSNSGGDLTESGGNGNSSGSGNPSPPMPALPEQRPTRPKDLDPDRIQVPSENMDYIRHLGLVPPELLAESGYDVHPDADGWVYLNLLCNLAQLHIINVTPDFVRIAVSEISTKFQLSPEGQKIRWRGGTEGTRFSSDSSGANSQRSPQTDDTDASKDPRKRLKTRHSGDEDYSGSSKHASKFGPQGSSESFHYKPMFVRQESSFEQTSMDGTMSSVGPADDSNVGSRWDQSGSGTSNRRKRRRDGAIIYYSGAPFCTDLSGDPGDISPTTYMLSSGQEQRDTTAQFARPPARRSESGSSLAYRPLSKSPSIATKMNIDNTPGLTTDSTDDASEVDFKPPWSDDQQYMEVRPLEPCGLGGVLPEDHFMVVVTTKRRKQEADPSLRSIAPATSEGVIGGIRSRLATMHASPPKSPALPTSSRGSSPAVEIEYVSGHIKRLAPVSLPPPAIFFPPFSNGTSSVGDDEFRSEEDSKELSSSEEFNASRRANPHHSDGYPDGVDLTSGDEDGEDPDEESDALRMYDGKNDSSEQMLPERRRERQPQSFSSADAAPGTSRGGSKSVSVSAEMLLHDGSSVATAGGRESGYSSSDEAS